jgi:lincosamide nucleotidyltransferase A/C/D/E
MAGRTRPRLWYRITGALNVLVWKLPFPHRVNRLLSAIVYRSPPMPASHVADVLALLERAGVRGYCTGGWGVDVLLGRQTRRHRDLDVIVDARDLGTAEAALHDVGYTEWYRHESDEPLQTRRVLWDAQARVVDLHPLDVELSGLRFAGGTVDGRPAWCLSAGVQEAQHRGYRPRRRDRLDLRRLRRVLLGPATALIIPVPDADAMLDDRAQRDHGMPPHVTLVEPFISGPSIDEATEDALAEAIESVPAFRLMLDSDDGTARPAKEAGAAGQPALQVQADEVWLMASDGERWICRTRFPLGPPSCDDGPAEEERRP